MSKKIAITGGIGSGKSTALKCIKDNGYQVLSCDEITTRLYQKRKIKLLIKRLFPFAVKGFFFPKLDRAKIANQVFTNPSSLKILTDTITPLIMEEVLKVISKTTSPIFVEVPLLYECNYQDKFDNVIIITRNKEQRIKSVMARSNLTEEQVVARMNSQIDYDTFDFSLNTKVLFNGECVHIGVKVIHFKSGSITGPPADHAYAVDPVGVEITTPSPR